jgi:septal ring-binding cell division protein DamX
MNTYRFIPILLLAGSLVIQSCGPSQEEIRAKEKVRQDSIARVESERMAKMEAERIAVEQKEIIEKKIEVAKAEKESKKLEFDAKGKYTVQVEASRSLTTAEKEIKIWKKRGFPDAFIVKFGSEETGEIWFRIRVGRFSTKQMANKAAELIFTDYKRKTWVTRAN